MIKLTAVIFGCIGTFLGYGQTLDWVRTSGGTSYDFGNAISVDVSGNVYTTGIFNSTIVDFDPSAGEYILNNNGGYDIFIQKLDASGNLLWAKSIGGPDFFEGSNSIEIDTYGNIYITGAFGNTVDFDPGSGTVNLTSEGDTDIFVLKLDADGNFIWVKSVGGMGYDVGYSSSIDALGNIYTTGHFEGTVDFDPGVGTAFLTSEGSLDCFVQKLDASGNFLWAKSFGGLSDDEARSIGVDASGNAYITGFFIGTVDFDLGAGTETHISAGGRDCFVQKLDASGNFLWAKTFGSTGEDYAFANSVDASGNVHTTGNFKEIVDFNPGTGALNLTSKGVSDVFVQKLDASGDFIWAQSFGGTDGDQGKAITHDALGNVYITGNFRGLVDFDPGIGTFNQTSSGAGDVYVQTLDASGNFVEAISFGATSTDAGNAISIDDSGVLYITGNFQETVDFDPGVGIENLTSEGSNDCFVLKLGATTVGLSDNNIGTDLLIYPNPIENKFTVTLPENSQGHFTIEIMDYLGKIVYRSTLRANRSTIELNSSIAAGAYFIKVYNETIQLEEHVLKLN